MQNSNPSNTRSQTHTNPLTVEMPKDADTFKAMLRLGIERFQGSPVVNEDKLRESLAASFSFNNYNSMSPLLKALADIPAEPEPELAMWYDIEEGEMSQDDVVTLGDTEIDYHLFHEDLVEYRFIEREEEILELYRMIGEGLGYGGGEHSRKNAMLMMTSLDELKGYKDTYVLSSTSYSGRYISALANPKEFTEACEAIIKVQNEQ